jgi:MFS family permease
VHDRPPEAPSSDVAAAAVVPPAWAGRTFAALANRDYRLFFVGMAVSNTGSWGRHTAQQWLVWELTKDERWLSWTSAVSLLMIAVVSVPAGVLADRVNKRTMLLWTQIGAMLLTGLLAALVLAGSVRPFQVALIAAGLGVLGGLEMPCRQAFVPEMVGRDTLRSAIALNSVMFNLPLIVGPAVAAWLMDAFGVGLVFVVDAASYLATIAAFLCIRAGARPAARATVRPMDELLAGVRYVAADVRVRTVLLLLATAMVFGWSYASLLAAYARETLHVGSRGYGLLFLSSGVGACLGALWVAGRRPTSPVATMAGCLAAFTLSLAVLAGVDHLVPALAARTVAGFAMIAFFAVGSTSVQLAVPDAIRGRVMALWTFTFALSLPLGQLLLGEVARRTSVPTAYAAGAAAIALGTALVLASARARARRP